MPTTTEKLLAEAAQCFSREDYAKALDLLLKLEGFDSQNFTATNLKALTCFQMGDYIAAIKWMRRCVDEQPENVECLYNLAMFHTHNGDTQKAFECHQGVVKLDPDHVNSLTNLGTAFSRGGMPDKALACYGRAMQLSPANAQIVHNSGNVFKDIGAVPLAIKQYERALELSPNYHASASNRCYLHNFLPGITLKKLYELHSEWGENFADIHEATWPDHPNDPDPDRVVRIGFISEDFRHHPVGRYLVSVLENLDDSFECICYYLRADNDEITERFKKLATEFVDAKRLSDDALADRVQSDEIDILFDLSGHTSGSRLRVFAFKPAPIQCTWLGYVGTTGLKAIDYKFASHASAPVGTDRYYTEKILRFPKEYPHQCYTPCIDVPIDVLPYDRNGYITFGSISMIAKLNNNLVSTWASILKRVPNSRLVLKAPMLEAPKVQTSLRTRLGLPNDSDRIIFSGFTPYRETLSVYNDIDIALDPFPFSGCTTSCEALWMGVPVVTLPGETEASRHTLSYLSSLKFVDVVANSVEHYVDIARNLAKNTGRLRSLRETLRQRLTSSPVCDASGFAREFSRLLRAAWQTWCTQRNSA